jgi:hypothetical protein
LFLSQFTQFANAEQFAVAEQLTGVEPVLVFVAVEHCPVDWALQFIVAPLLELLQLPASFF